MHPFEFVTVLVSIIVGLGIAVLLEGLARVFRGELEGYWVQLVWSLAAFLLLVQNFWSLFVAADRTNWTLFNLSNLLVAPMLIFLFAAILFPAAGSVRRLRSHYYDRRRSLFSVLSILFLYYNLENPGFTFADLSQFVPLIIAVTLLFTDRPRVHEILAVVFTVGAAISIGIFSFRLGENPF